MMKRSGNSQISGLSLTHPYCGGLHTLTVDVGDESTEQELVLLVTVTGVPPVGSQVMRGPNGYGAVEGEVVRCNESSKKITIKTSTWNRFNLQYSEEVAWGRNDEYEIQLKH